MREPERIIETFAARERARSKLDAEHGRIRRILDGDASVLWQIMANTGLDETPTPSTSEIYTANMLLMAGDQLSRRIAANPTIRDFATSDKPAAKKRSEKAEAWKQYVWRENKMNLTGRQVSKWLLAYAEAPIVCVPDPARGMPCYEERDPLTAYPAEAHTWRPNPSDIVFRYRRTIWDLAQRYESAAVLLARAANVGRGEMFREIDVLEWHDSEHTCLVANAGEKYGHVELEYVDNRAERPLFVVPRLITFGERQGQFNQLAGLMAAQARLTILMMMAAERAVFPETFIAGDLVSAGIAQGPDAVTLLDKDATVNRLGYNSSIQFFQDLDRFERNLRLGAGVPAQFGGETPSTLATGRGNQVLIGATVDEGVRERQEILGEAYRELVEASVAMARSGMLGDPERSIHFISRKEDVDEAASLAPTALPVGTTRVEYGLLSSADSSSATVIIGQLVGTEMISEEGARDLHPFIDQPRLEGRRVKTQRIDRAMLASIETMASQVDPVTGLPRADVRVLARIKKALDADIPLEDAIAQAFPEAEEAGEVAPTLPEGAPQPDAAPGRPGFEQVLSRLYGSGAAPTAVMQAGVPL